jgi:hypothetical protein
VTPRMEGGYTVFQRAHIRVIPKAPLQQEAWYFLSVGKVPPGLVSRPGPLEKSLAGRGTGVRFAVGSSARLSSLQVCDGGAGVSKVMVVATERLTSQAIAAANVSIESVGASCTLKPAVSHTGTEESIRFECKGLQLETGLSVHFENDLLGRDQRIVRKGRAAPIRAQKEAFVQAGSCKVVDIL